MKKICFYLIHTKNKVAYKKMFRILRKLVAALVALMIATELPAQFNSHEKAAIDELVVKNIITPECAAQITKDYSLITSKKSDTKKIKIFGAVQAHYDFMDAQMDERAGTCKEFNLRRVLIGAQVDISDSLHLEIVSDLKRTKTNGSDYVFNAFARKDVDYEFLQGNLQIGFRKVQFTYEESFQSTALDTVETSIPSNYFANSQRTESRLGFGQRYVGLHWTGTVREIKGFKYNIAITNSMNNTIYPTAHLSGNSNNPQAKADLNYWLAMEYTTKIDELNSIKIGVKSGFGNNANIVSNDKYGRIIGIDPFIEYKYGSDFSAWAEFLYANVQYGKNSGNDTACPCAYNIGAKYMFEIPHIQGKIALVGRFSQLFTDGRGVCPKDVLTYYTDISGQNPNSYDKCWSVYAGINWYLLGSESLKIQLSYEYANFSDALHSYTQGDTRANIIRAQLQVLF